MFDGWVGVPKMKYFDIIVHGWLDICSDRVTLWICSMGGWVFLK